MPQIRTIALFPAFLLLGACAAKVSHPTKTLAEQQVDINQCTDRANEKYWMDPIAALYNAYDCLEAKGYQRGNAQVAGQVQRAVRERRPATQGGEPGKPCRVPCTSPRG